MAGIILSWCRLKEADIGPVYTRVKAADMGSVYTRVKRVDTV